MHQPKAGDFDRKINNHKPRYDLENIKWFGVGMGENDAFLSGYKHGWMGLDTRNVNCLTKDSPEWAAWERGYTEGEKDREYALNYPL